MAKRQIGWTEAKISRYIKEGKGQAELALYKPWLTLQDVPSSGRVHRFIGWKTSREHHLLSDLEFNYHCFYDWADNVIDIREQFPLDREVTLQIADDLGIKHPLDNKTNTNIVMTIIRILPGLACPTPGVVKWLVWMSQRTWGVNCF